MLNFIFEFICFHLIFNIKTKIFLCIIFYLLLFNFQNNKIITFNLLFDFLKIKFNKY